MSCVFCSKVGHLKECAEFVKEYMPDKRLQFCPICGEKFTYEASKASLYPMEMTLQEVVDLCKIYDVCYPCPFYAATTGGCVFRAHSPEFLGDILAKRARDAKSAEEGGNNGVS